MWNPIFEQWDNGNSPDVLDFCCIFGGYMLSFEHILKLECLDFTDGTVGKNLYINIFVLSVNKEYKITRDFIGNRSQLWNRAIDYWQSFSEKT